MDYLFGFLIAVGGALVGALIIAQLPPDYRKLRIFGYVVPQNRILGKWNSWWGPTEDRVKAHNEVINFTDQHKDRLWGIATREQEPNREWELFGRFDGHYLQLVYFPSQNSVNPNFLDYGCYFLKRQADGSFKGFSAGFGPDEDTGADSLTTECSYMEQVK